MAFLVIDGTTVTVREDSLTFSFMNVGENFGSSLATGTQANRDVVRRRWTMETVPMTVSTALTLATAINQLDLAIYGTMVDRASTNTITCSGKVDDIEIEQHAKEPMAVVKFSLTENSSVGTITWHSYTAPEPDNPFEGDEVDTGLKVVAYCFGNPSTVDPTIMTHINYAFGEISGTSVTVATAAHLTTLVGLKATNPSLKCILSVGGWGVDFTGVMDTEAHRQAFAASCASWVSTYSLDGIDIDFEYPDGATERSQFTSLMQEVRDAIPVGKLVTIATPGGVWADSSFDLAALEDICDYIMVMNYDFNRSGAAHHANLYDTAWTSYDCHTTMEYYMDYVTDPLKLIFGIPVYGYIYDGDSVGVSKTYDQLVASYLGLDGYSVQWDNTAKAAYLWKDSAFQGSYESTGAIAEKSTYIKANGYGGAMYWEYLQDDTQTLTGLLWDLIRST